MKTVSRFVSSIIIIVWSAAFFSCAEQKKEGEVFIYLFENKWDSIRSHSDDSDRYLNLVLSLKERLKEKYSFEVTDSLLILRVEKSGAADTIKYQWEKNTNRVRIDSLNVLKLFSREEAIRVQMVNYFMKVKQPVNAWAWLVSPRPLSVDSVYGEFYHKYYYVFKTEKFDLIVPHIEKAWREGHANSGLALATWYGLTRKRDRSILILKNLSEKNNSDAMVALGDIYDTFSSDLEWGYHPPKGTKKTSSFDWYKRAALLKNSFAMEKLAYIYKNGIDRDANIDSALYWLRKASNLGSGFASAEIAECYLNGYDLDQNLDSGRFWIQRSIEQDPATGYFELGVVYEKGLGFEKSIEMALKYYNKSDSLGSPTARAAIQRILKLKRNR
jgi:TPR repeat protein